MKNVLSVGACAFTVITAASVSASTISIGPNGINSAGLVDFNGMPLTGGGIAIGQVELLRPGDPTIDTTAARRHALVNPTEVYFRDPGPPLTFAPTANDAAEIAGHATWVAGVMISTDTTNPDMDGDSPTGVATAAELYSIGFNVVGPDFDEEVAVSTQHIITEAGNLRAINMSFANPLVSPHVLDGNQHLTQFVDWSASQDNILYVVAGNQVGDTNSIPTDNFNGMTIAASERVGAQYRRVWSDNRYDQDAEFNRRSISLIAPGVDVKLANLGTVPTMPPHPSGTSIATPHVTGTVALLQDYAEERIMASATGWGANARQHEVMKAVLMNSADKIRDDGTFIPPGETTPIPAGRLLGMERTVVKQDGTSTWFDSDAYNDAIGEQGGFWPTDEEMGTGHLNASRALVQFRTGEFESSNTVDVPAIGWDYGTTSGTDDINRYRISPELRGGSFISITLAWDRVVTVDTEAGAAGDYDIGDTYEEFVDDGINPLGDSVINNMRLFVLPKGGAPSQLLATSDANEGTVQHIFYQLPDTGEYEFWVEQLDEDVGTTQDYAIAWWSAPASLVAQGDFNDDGMVDAADLAQWRGDFGVNDESDADGDGDSDGADFLAWQRGLGTTSATPTASAVPEPATVVFALACIPLLLRRRGS